MFTVGWWIALFVMLVGLYCCIWGGRIALAVAIIGAVFVLKPAFGQDHSGHRPQDMEIHRKFYNTWQMPDNRAMSCCHEQDCRPAEVRSINGWLHARLEGDDGDFTLIPPAKIEQ